MKIPVLEKFCFISFACAELLHSIVFIEDAQLFPLCFLLMGNLPTTGGSAWQDLLYAQIFCFLYIKTSYET